MFPGHPVKDTKIASPHATVYSDKATWLLGTWKQTSFDITLTLTGTENVKPYPWQVRQYIKSTDNNWIKSEDNGGFHM